MDNQINKEIEELEFALASEYLRIKQEHGLLKEKLKQLSQQLAITIKTYEKFQIMKDMDEIENKIKNDLERYKHLKEQIEEKKRRKRIENYQEQTVIATTNKINTLLKISQIESTINKPQSTMEIISSNTNRETVKEIYSQINNFLSPNEKLLLATLLLNDLVK